MLRVRDVKDERPASVKRFYAINSMYYEIKTDRVPNSALHRDLGATPHVVRDSLTIVEQIFSADLQFSACGPPDLEPAAGRLPCRSIGSTFDSIRTAL